MRLQSLVHFIASSLDKKNKFVRLCFLDFSNAFNTVDRNILCSLLPLKRSPSLILSRLSVYFSDRKQFVVHGSKCSSLLTHNFGVIQGAILSPFLFSFCISDMPHPDCLALFKYSDDISLGCASSSCSDVNFQRGLDLIVDWTTERGLSINSLKSFDVCFSLSSLDKHIILTSSLSHLSINGTPIPKAQKFKFAGVNHSYNLKWSGHISFVFTKVHKLSFYVRRLRSFYTPQFLIDCFVFCCILLYILYCFPVVFCDFLSKDWKLISRCLKLIAKCRGISLTRLQEFASSKHLSSCELFASKILSDTQHPLHSFLSNSRLSRPSRSSYKHIFARTNAYKNSVFPYLARFLTNKQKVRDELFFIHS